MAPGSWVDEYQRLNGSFEPTCVFRLGVEAGFFSALNNMVLAVLYCLKHGIEFRLSSASANFAIDLGITDYFLPVFAEENDWYHRFFNCREWLTPEAERLAQKMKASEGVDYFTQDVFDRFRTRSFEREHFDFPTLGINGGLLHATGVVIENIWHLQPAVQREIDAAKAQLGLPDDYVGLHIRRGDKVKEARRVSTSEFIAEAEKHTDIRTAFVATDDYRAITEIESRHPGWTIKTLCDETATGHRQDTFDRQDKADLYRGIVRLLADAEILHGANVAVVTYSSNVGMFVGMRAGCADRPRLSSLDPPEWRIW